MNIRRISEIGNAVTETRVMIYILAFITFVLQIPSFRGEDIINARENYLTGARTDFWGGISTLVYSNVPEYLFRWQIWLAMFQIAMTASGLIKFFKTSPRNRKAQVLTLAVSYLALMFSGQMTRDGLMFSLLVFGYSLLSGGARCAISTKSLLTATLLIILGASFRPWLSLALAPLTYLMLQRSSSKFGKAGICLLLVSTVILPPTLEVVAVKTLELTSSYPEQQVMLMDAAASYCYSNNYSTGIKAREIIRKFSSDQRFENVACQFFRPDTWLSLTKSNNPSSDGMKSDLWLVPAGEENQYREVRNAWLDLITSDPITYLQNKSLFITKLLIGSDSRGLGIASADSIFEIVTALYTAPYDLAISLHLFSLLACILFLALLSLGKSSGRWEVRLDPTVLLILLTILLWTVISSVAYIGSNGRYTYSITILIAVIYTLTSADAKELYRSNE